MPENVAKLLELVHPHWLGLSKSEVKMKITKGEAKKQGILEVARKFFYEKGYEETSVQDIIDELETSKGSFYHHFESKMEVLLTLCEQEIEKAFLLYKKNSESQDKSIEKLNLLLYYANPIHKGAEDFLAVFLPLIAKVEGKTIATQYADLIEKTFYPSLQALLEEANEEGKMFLYYPNQISFMILSLNNDFWKKAGLYLTDSIQNNQELNTAYFVEIVRAFRFAVERLTDVSFGSVEVITVKEWLSVLEKVSKIMK